MALIEFASRNLPVNVHLKKNPEVEKLDGKAGIPLSAVPERTPPPPSNIPDLRWEGRFFTGY
jgi:hypothetical protein